MKKLVLLICSLAVVFSCITVAYAWPKHRDSDTFLLSASQVVFRGHSIAILVCDPIHGTLNGNECLEVSYDALVDLRDDLVMQACDVRLVKGLMSDYYYLVHYDHSGNLTGCIGDNDPASYNVYRAKDPTVSSKLTIKEIAGTGIYWIDSTAVSSLEYHYVDSAKFDNISRTLHIVSAGRKTPF